MSDPWIGKTLGRYRIESQIGRGGMGVVYRGRQLSLNRPVAIKFLPTELAQDPEFVRRFEQEAQVIAGLAHENIVYVFDITEDDGTLYIVMELIDGESLAVYRSGRMLNVEEIRQVGLGLARALAIAGHRRCGHGVCRERSGSRCRGHHGRQRSEYRTRGDLQAAGAGAARRQRSRRPAGYRGGRHPARLRARRSTGKRLRAGEGVATAAFDIRRLPGVAR